MSDMYDRLVDLLVNRFEVDPAAIGPDVTFEDLDVDSLFLVELLLVVQHDLAQSGVKISEDVAAPSDTIAGAAKLIENQIAAAASS